MIKMKKIILIAIFILVGAVSVYADATTEQIVAGTRTGIRDFPSASLYTAGAARIDDTYSVTCNHALGTDPNEGQCQLLQLVDENTLAVTATSTYVNAELFFSTYNGDQVCRIDTDQFVVVYADDALGDDGFARVGTISGGSISYGTALEFETGDTEDATCAGTDTDQFMIFYNDETASDVAQVRACGVSGTTITCGTISRVDGTTDYLPRNNDCSALNQDKFVCSWRASDLGNDAYVVAGTINGSNNITLGSPVLLEDGNIQWLKIDSTYDSGSTADQFVATYASTTVSSVVACTVSGTAITCGTKQDYTVNSGSYMRDQSSAFIDGTTFGILGKAGNNNNSFGIVVDVDWGTRTFVLGNEQQIDVGSTVGINETHSVLIDRTDGIAGHFFRDSSGGIKFDGFPWRIESLASRRIFMTQ